ncbi:hypothetical protein [uncultured Tateyamaria sp.]|uniref:hypothetical protein n=1 Tax=uncultured Tateyamaria sp. TaxID=455651 RepID=UPI00262816FA|nr:hypothetical protein [uncultured Tateyamaria sp.]
MQKPSESWQKLQRATAERAYRTVIEPLKLIDVTFFAACILYLIGFFQLQYFDYRDGVTWLMGAQILLVAIAGLLVPILIGSFVTIHLTKRRLESALLQSG